MTGRIKRKYTKELLDDLAGENISVMGIMRGLGFECLTGGSHSHISKLLKKFNIDTSHFMGQGHNKGKIFPPKRCADDILVKDRSGKGAKEKTKYLRRALVEIGRDKVCEKCGVSDIYNGHSITLEIHHKDGNSINNERDNLAFLCPNCHSQDKYFNKQKSHFSPKSKKAEKLRLSKRCPSCSKTMSGMANKCYRCKSNSQKRYAWPTKEELLKLVWEKPTTKIAKGFGVSDQAISKLCKKYKIKKPPRGYWAKRSVGIKIPQ